MFTLLAKVEAILNSRPVCALSSEPREINVLTPGHFLVGGPLVAIPEGTWDEASHRRSLYQMLQKLTQGFWRTWQRDYLYTLQQKTKWFKPTPNIKLNDVVIIVEPNLPPTQWRLAIVEELHPGKDNIVRVVTLQTANGHFMKRRVVKTCPLPIN
ncbi:hypothetical protein EVAR_38062_1 [Eumeta japonica]|uniref:DUF5641 domain-containing protein n=1 Tax=Eumeta variegata TaxID=151549 RepID=A0A4C1W7F7_EUMVA|nr:hypothetical protein EVAR_38062_1 [Eumeta japonica]